ncbi:MAG TPA: CPBP family intramembrane glutamic endopeptidase [Terracidiphilus sp.]|jgi:uncharacterized protein|nr:CPBP family intramembrane glutamic endopeptidase [Terracidiphilus sp.]
MSGIPEDELFRTTEGEPLRSENGHLPIPEDAREAMPEQGLGAEVEPEELAPLEPVQIAPLASEPPVWMTTEPETERPVRIPHLGHLLLMLLVLTGGFAAAIVLILIALHFHVYGISSIEQTKSEIHYQLGSEGLGYLFTLLGCVMVFPLVWNKGFFAGVQWNVGTAVRLRWWLVGAAFICFLLALLNSVVLPGPKHTPIEDIFREPGAAWLLFVFGVTFAPFFEELFFRGFLLPAFCTAFDWVAARVDKQPQGETRSDGRPRWARGASLVAAAATAVPFAAACTLASKRYLLIGILLFFAWCCTAALIWTIGRSSKPTVSYTLVDENGHPVWSFPAMACLALFTSVPFALMHAPQTGFSVGPFLLLVGVSVVLCSVRLWTRSLAASTLVHASYNFMLFAIMMVGTQGFRHMDKM